MKFILNILKAFLFSFCFIGIASATDCPSISPKMAADNPTEQVEAIVNDVICSFIELHSESNGTLQNTLNLTKKKIIPYMDLEHSTELALGDYWKDLDTRQRKIFERDVKNSLIKDYVSILADMKDWKDINVSVDNQYSQTDNIANVKVLVSLKNESSSAAVTLRLIRKNRWKIYDLVYQTISIVDIEKVGYDSKIKRQGIDGLIEKMLSRS
jgi:phospholipid transport system substrate-binding protein